ncbi:MAG TPA: sulfotransferase [Solirubrobacteraceae bacterium]|jgi:hypothetical protein|nr:sulfotransferase [Solirubrobacteraceae bacterium]
MSTSEAETAISTHRPKVVYVMGGHRIGSTVLGVTLGNCADVFFAGEVHCWFTRRGVPAYGGEGAETLWRAVREKVTDAEELFGHDTELYLDRSSALYRLNKWPLRRRLRPRYQRMTTELYRAIANVAGASHIVDTSHYPLRARELQRLEGVELFILFLVRDPQEVIASFDPRGDAPAESKPKLRANFHMWVTHLLSLLVFLRQPRARRLFLRHEQFVADPENVVRQILDRVGSPAEMPDFTSLETGYPLQGNRFLRSSKVIALSRATRKRARSSWFTALVQSPWVPVFRLLRPRVKAGSAGGAPEPQGQTVASDTT